jgi:VWFA-related protein
LLTPSKLMDKRRLGMSGLVASLLPLLSVSSLAAQEQPPAEPFGEEITVALARMTVRVIGPDQEPVLGLGPEDFHVVVGAREVPVYSVDWVSSAAPSGAAPSADAPGAAAPEGTAAGPPAPAGKRIVFFVEASQSALRTRGYMALRPHLRKLLDALPPGDRVAVVSFDNPRLELWQDFTRDREAVYEAIARAMYFDGRSITEASGEPVSLAANLDFEEARRTTTHAAALTATAKALEVLAGEKVILYLGYSFSWRRLDGWRMDNELDRVLQALHRAGASLFVLDGKIHVDSTSFYDEFQNANLFHDLFVALADQGGGAYLDSRSLPYLGNFAGVLSGHYVLSFDLATLPESGTFEVRLRDGRKGRVLARPSQVSP